MKKEQTKPASRKKYSILLVALLLIGVATYGTYAYFTDSKDVDSNLALTNGSVKLDDFDTKTWTYKGNTKDQNSYTDEKLSYKNPNLTPTDSSNTFSNVLPGDTFTKTISINYSGTAQADIKVNLDTTAIIDNQLEYSFKVKNGDTTTDLKSGETELSTLKNNNQLTFDLTIHVPYGSETQNLNTSEILASVPKMITVTATQHLESNN